MTVQILNLKKKRKLPALDPARIFASAETSDTVRRVVAFLSPVYFGHSYKSFDHVSKPVAFVEEFFVAMPTEEAFDAEIALCEAILAHAAGQMTGESVKVYLKKYLDSHTFVYEWEDFGKVTEKVARRIKDGSEFAEWEKQIELYNLTFAGESVVCNPVQMWLIYLLEKSRNENIKMKAVKL